MRVAVTLRARQKELGMEKSIGLLLPGIDALSLQLLYHSNALALGMEATLDEGHAMKLLCDETKFLRQLRNPSVRKHPEHEGRHPWSGLTDRSKKLGEGALGHIADAAR